MVRGEGTNSLKVGHLILRFSSTRLFSSTELRPSVCATKLTGIILHPPQQWQHRYCPQQDQEFPEALAAVLLIYVWIQALVYGSSENQCKILELVTIYEKTSR